MLKPILLFAVVALFAAPAAAQSVDEIIGHYLKSVGGREKIQALNTLRCTGEFNEGGGFEAVVVQENERSNMVREEFSLQGMTAINA